MQYPWILRAATLLDDPIMMEWAVHYYHDLPPRSELKKQLEELWFHDATIKRWIGADDPKVLSLMFLYLPAQCFATFASTIASQWVAWAEQLSSSPARVLASVSPDQAAETFGRYLETVKPWSFEKAISILENLDKLPSREALAMLEKLLCTVRGDKGFFASSIRHRALGPAARLMPQALPELLDGLFAEKEDRLDGIVKSMALALFGHDAYADLYFMRRDEYEVACFTELAPLFDSDAPLAEMDEIVLSETPLPAALRLLEVHHGRSPESAMAWDTIRQSEVFRSGEHSVELAALALAGVAAAFEHKSVDAARLSIGDAIALLALDVNTNIHYGVLLERLRNFPGGEVAVALVSRIGEVHDTFGGITLARVMGDLGWAEFTQPLIGCIGEMKGDFICDAAQQALLNIGEPARDALMAHWDELDSTQKIYGGAVIADVGGDAVADFALSRFDELMHDDIERWCDLARTAPDQRMIEKLRPELRRKQALIDGTYYRLCRLLDAEGGDLPDVHKRILQQRERQQKAMENFYKGDFIRDRKTLRLSLCCTACGEVNDYDAKGVVVDDKGGNPLIADEFPCLSCGAWAEFEFQPMARMSLMAELMRVSCAHETGEKNIESLVQIRDAVTYGGTKQPLAAAYAELRGKIRDNPDDWLSLFRLGNILRHINRPKAAVECFRKAHAGNPLSMDAIINLAAMLVDSDRKKEAFELLNRTLERSANWQALASHPAEKAWEVAQLFNQLRRDLGRYDIPALHPGFLGSAPKVGRNDPCTCGSGKKFKKCCGAPQAVH